MNSSIGISDVFRISAAISSTRPRFVPARSARSDARWITGPSAIGSENGTPSSIRSAPPRSSAATSAGVRLRVRIAGGEVGNQRRTALLPQTLEQLRDARHYDVEFLDVLAVDVDVFVAAAGEIDDKDLVLRRGRAPDGFGDRVRRFERRNDSFGARQQFRRLDRLDRPSRCNTRRGPGRAATRARDRPMRSRGRPRRNASARPVRRRPAEDSCRSRAARRARLRENRAACSPS